MNFLKNIARATALAIATASFAVQAAPVQASVSNMDDHGVLVDAILRHGVSVEINTPECFEDEGFLGFYAGWQRRMVICQEAALNSSNPIVGENYGFSEEDLDTLRHEAQHFIQDCMVGTRHDHDLGPVYQEPVKYGIFTLGAERVARIIEVYRGNGATRDVVILEIEAFAVAAENEPLVQAEDIYNYCAL